MKEWESKCGDGGIGYIDLLSSVKKNNDVLKTASRHAKGKSQG
jgi:hypothetical protein